MAKDEEALALSPELAQLEHIATAADAQLDGAAAALVPGEAPPPEVDETAEVAGALTLIATIGGMAIPPLAEVYDATACQAIAVQYMRCADEYGWTWHKNMNSPVVGLVAAAAMPAVLNAGKFRAWADEQKAKALAAQRQARGEQSKTTPMGAPMGVAPIAPMGAHAAAPPMYSPGHVGAGG